MKCKRGKITFSRIREHVSIPSHRGLMWFSKMLFDLCTQCNVMMRACRNGNKQRSYIIMYRVFREKWKNVK